MSPQVRLFIGLGVACLVIAGVLLAVESFSRDSRFRLGNLPGDISIQRENFSFYAPLTTCLVISVVLPLVFWLLRR